MIGEKQLRCSNPYVALDQLGDSLKEIQGSAFGGNILLDGGPAYEVKSIIDGIRAQHQLKV